MSNWYQESSAAERKTFWACFMGWALDALDVQMFSLAIPALIASLRDQQDRGRTAGIRDAVCRRLRRLDRRRTGGPLRARQRRCRSPFCGSRIATFACAFAQTYPQLLVLKTIQGIGFGGEWAAGAVLMAEVIRPQHRGKVLAAVQSAWAVGWGAAVILATALFSHFAPDIAWRAMFAAGLLPALLIFFVRRGIPEPARALTPAAQQASPLQTLLGIFRPDVLRTTLIGGLFGVGAHGGYAALTTFLPTFLREERKLSVLSSGGYLAVIIVAFFCGCVASGILSDRIGRRANVVVFAAACVLTVLIYVFAPLSKRPDAGARISARLLFRRHSRQHGRAVQRDFIRRAFAAPASGSATISAASSRRAFRSWSDISASISGSARPSASTRPSPIRWCWSPCCCCRKPAARLSPIRRRWRSPHRAPPRIEKERTTCGARRLLERNDT